MDMVALNADVVGYSALVADDLDATTEAMDSFHRLFETEVAREGGTLANFVGDSFMAVFDDAMAGLRCAISIATEAEERNLDTPRRRWVRFRMGLDLGSVSSSEGRYHGDALNIAARIQAIAPNGGISISGSVYRAIDEPALRFRPVGRQRLKNIPEQVDVYQFVDLPTRGAGAGEAGRSLALDAPTIAVLPIHTETVDDGVRSAAQVIRGDLIHRLSAVPGLNVIDASTQLQGDGATARYMLETGVNQLGSRIRVFATLFDVTTMNIVKSYKWTAESQDMFELSDTIADEVARAVEVELVVGEPAGLYAELDDPRAIEKVYLGWYHMRSDTREGWSQALDLFKQVADTHPEHPYGFVLAAFALWLGATNDWTPDVRATLDEAREFARRGGELGDPTGMAETVEAAILMWEGNVDQALEKLDHVEIVRPTCDVTYGLEGSLRRYLGQWERSVELMDTAMRLTGINKPWYPTVKACSLFLGDQNEEAAMIAEGVLEYQPNNLEALLVLTAAQVELGMDRKSKATADLIRQRYPSVNVEEWLDKNPYQRKEIVERWKADLESSGAIQPA